MAKRLPEQLYLLGQLVAFLQANLSHPLANHNGYLSRLLEKTRYQPHFVIHGVNLACEDENLRDIVVPIMKRLSGMVFLAPLDELEQAIVNLGHIHYLGEIQAGSEGFRELEQEYEEKNDAVLNVRIPSSLKCWLDEKGTKGAANIVRVLLRNAKAQEEL